MSDSLSDNLRMEFIAEVENIVHDLRAPLSSLAMIVKHSKEISESVRADIHEAMVCIDDIANNILNTYKPGGRVTSSMTVNQSNNGINTVLLSTTLLEMLTEKKYQYHDLAVKLDSKITSIGYFSFVQFDLELLRGIVSDLLDMVVDANHDDKIANITVKLDNDGALAKIVIEDNCYVLSQEIVTKIMNNCEMSDAEKEQYAALLRVRELMLNNQCRFTLKSKEAKGTRITLILPISETPSWVADAITLNRGDTVIILDDEQFIHKAWDTRFSVEAPYTRIKHFTTAHEVINFVHALTAEEKQKIVLLADYELAKNEPSGVQLMQQLGIERSVLVTNHYDSIAVRAEVASVGSKILPKQLALEVPLKVNIIRGKFAEHDTLLADEVNLIVVDDDPLFIKNLCKFVFHDRVAESYTDPQDFLDNVLKYPKDITILLDYDFGPGKLSGLDVSKELHTLGFTGFRILSGRSLSKREIPDYVDAFVKTDLDNIKQL